MKLRILVILILPQIIFCQRWTNISSLPGAYFKITFKSQLQGWALADNIKIWHTSDGGYNWEKQAEYPDISFRKIYFLDTLKGWCVGSGGVILSTNDGGKTWNKNVTDNRFKLTSIYFSGNTGWITGYVSYIERYVEYLMFGILLKSIDNGNSWNKISDSTLRGLNDICFINEKEGWAAGFEDFSDVGASYVIHTTNGGINWYEQKIKNTGDINYIGFYNNKIGWATGFNCPILRTIDGGENWTRNYFGSVYSCLAVLDSNEIWTSDGNKIFHTKDGCVSWETDTLLPKTSFISDISFFGKKTGFAIKRDGIVLRYKEAFSDIKSFNNITISDILSNCYPNPANSITKIDYYIQRESNVKIVIFDALGREIKTLINDKRKSGLYSVFFDGSNYNSGIYYYRMISDDFAETKKLLLLK